jgi:hypothetical protein
MHFSFYHPLYLISLLLLPLIYFLIKLTPPQPHVILFPPISILKKLVPAEKTPKNSPLLLLIVRLFLVGAIITALAGPYYQISDKVIINNQPLLIVVDDSWSSAQDWDQRKNFIQNLIHEAELQSVPTYIYAASDNNISQFIDYATTRNRIKILNPKPYVPNYSEAINIIREFTKSHENCHIVWLAPALAHPDAGEFITSLESDKKKTPNISIYANHNDIKILRNPINQKEAIHIDIENYNQSLNSPIEIIASDFYGNTLFQQHFDQKFQTKDKILIKAPLELRNKVSHLRINNQHTAGSVALLDDRSRRARIGIFAQSKDNSTQPLLSAYYFLSKALNPFADIVIPNSGSITPIDDLLSQNITTLILSDVGLLTEPDEHAVAKFLTDGGSLIRFSGPNLAAKADDLLPVKLRPASRNLGGAISWEKPKKIAQFEHSSPFYEFSIPDDILISRQLLAEPTNDLNDKTWVRLEDGTPLVTADRRGKGLLVFFHISAETSWSNLPISGLFIDMLNKLSLYSFISDEIKKNDVTEINNSSQLSLRAVKLLDGFGNFLPGPIDSVPSISLNNSGFTDSNNLPGFYVDGSITRAVQPISKNEILSKLDDIIKNKTINTLDDISRYDLSSVFLLLSVLLFLIDTLLSTPKSNLSINIFKFPKLILFITILLAPNDEAYATSSPSDQLPSKEMISILTSRLAYVLNGDNNIDATAYDGLKHLTNELRARTSYEPGDPIGLDLNKDDLSLYPLIYWPIYASMPQPNEKVIQKLATFMRFGGTVIFDTRNGDAYSNVIGESQESSWLRLLLQQLDVPVVEQVPRDHVITKTYYLINKIQGSSEPCDSWVEKTFMDVADEQRNNFIQSTDNVSSLIITSCNLASAWSRFSRENNFSSNKDTHNLELAMRSGINIVMYTLTGNYKSDQVHKRRIIERLQK